MQNTKASARVAQGRLPLATPILGFETPRLSSKDSGTAPLSFSRKRHTASGGALGHESVSMPSAPTLGTAFKTGRAAGYRGFKAVKDRLKSSKDSAYRQSLRTTASDAHESESSKDWFGRDASSKDFGGIGA